jgi:hypothetical protein
VDPDDSVADSGTDEFGLLSKFPRLSTSFLRQKAEHQLRNKLGQWREERGDLDLVPTPKPRASTKLKLPEPVDTDIDAWEPPPKVNKYPLKDPLAFIEGVEKFAEEHGLEARPMDGVQQASRYDPGEWSRSNIRFHEPGTYTTVGGFDQEVGPDEVIDELFRFEDKELGDSVMKMLHKTREDAGIKRSTAVLQGYQDVDTLIRNGYDFDWERQRSPLNIPNLKILSRVVLAEGPDQASVEASRKLEELIDRMDGPQDQRPSIADFYNLGSDLPPRSRFHDFGKRFFTGWDWQADLVKHHGEPPELEPDIRTASIRIVTPEQYDAAAESLLADPKESLPRVEGVVTDSELVYTLLAHWIRASKHYKLAPELEGQTVDLDKASNDEVAPIAKTLVAESLSNATADTVTTKDLQDILYPPTEERSDIPVLGSSRTVNPLNPGESIGAFVKMKDTNTLVAVPAGIDDEYIPLLEHLQSLGFYFPWEKDFEGSLQKGLDEVGADSIESYRDQGEPVPLENMIITRAGTPKADTMIRDYYMGNIVHVWAQSSNDEHAISLAFQEAAKQLLPEGAAPKEWQNDQVLQQEIDRLLATKGDQLIAILEAQRAATTEMLRALGSDKVPLFRGTRTSPDRLPLKPGDEKIFDVPEQVLERTEPIIGPIAVPTTQRPISSWATDPVVAWSFGSSGSTGPASGRAEFPFLISTDIPIEEILSTTLTGFGAYDEAEMVSLFNLREALAARISKYAMPFDATNFEELMKEMKRLRRYTPPIPVSSSQFSTSSDQQGQTASAVEFGLLSRFPRLSTSFLRQKAEHQLRNRLGRWREERGDLDLVPEREPRAVTKPYESGGDGPDVDAWEPPPTSSEPPGLDDAGGPIRRTVTPEQFEATVQTLIADPAEALPRNSAISTDPQMVRGLLAHWIQTSKYFQLPPELEPEMDNIDLSDDPDRDKKTIASLAKTFVAETLSNATADTITTENLRDLIHPTDGTASTAHRKKDVPILGTYRTVDPLNTGESIGAFVKLKRNNVLYAAPAGVDEDYIPLMQMAGLPMMDWANDFEKSLATAFRVTGFNEKSYQEYLSNSPKIMSIAKVGTPEAETMIRDYYMGKIVNIWAKTSNDENTFSLAFQEAAKKLLPEGAAPKEWKSEPWLQKEVDTLLAEKGDQLTAILEAQREATTEMLRGLGAERIRLYRGTTVDPSRLPLKPGDEYIFEGKPEDLRYNEPMRGPVAVETTQRPISSWATDPKIAWRFGSLNMTGPTSEENQYPFLIAADITIGEILSTTLTGFGAFSEAEMVSLFNLREALVARLPKNSSTPLLSTEELMKEMQRAKQDERLTPVQGSTGTVPLDWQDQILRAYTVFRPNLPESKV